MIRTMIHFSDSALEFAGLAPCGCDYKLENGALMYRPAGSEEEWCEIFWEGLDEERENKCCEILAYIISEQEWDRN